MYNINYEDICKDTKISISLTKNCNHEINIEPGQGSFTIGVKGIDKDDVDVWVDKDDKINWNAFYDCEKYFKGPMHDSTKWPRFFYYTGNDIGFIEWSNKRKIEIFKWKPQKNMNVDFTNANIYQLGIDSNYKLNLSFGKNINHLDLYGNPNNYIVDNCLKTPSLGFHFNKYIDNQYVLPKYDCFKDVENLLIESSPNGVAFDCNSLLQFPNLKLLHLVGNMTNLQALKKLKHLNNLGLWNIEDLSNFPSLDNWKELNNFVASNIDENVGKRLKEEAKILKKERKFEFISITKLRNKLWFENEFNLPFSNWDSKIEKKATSIYKKYLKEITTANTKNDIKNIVINYTNCFNKLNDIETIERDDIYKSLCMLMKNSSIFIEEDVWLKWFNEIRDF